MTVQDVALNERIVAELGLGVLLLDPRGRVRHANRPLVDMLGLTGDLVGVDVRSALAQYPTLADLATGALAAPGGRLEAVGIVVGGEPRRLIVRAAALGADPAAAGIALAVLDVTSVRAAEAERRRVATFTGLARFVSHVAHELKNPLGALKLYALLLQRQSRDDRPGGTELIEKVTRAVDQLSTVIGEITSLASVGPVEPETVALATILDECLKGMAERLKAAPIEVVRRDIAPEVTASADPRALKRVLTTLIQNAIDAMPDGGRLTVGVSATGAREVALTVQDSGGGMPEDVQAQLFEPFFTTKAAGTGLALALARQIIEKLGGRLEVHSRVGVGTTVRVAFPAGTQAGDHGRRTHPGH